MTIEVPIVARSGLFPTRAHEYDAGLDLKAGETVDLRPGEYRRVSTGVRVAIPKGCVGYVNPRSGLAAKYGVTVLNAPGTIDAGYRGEIDVLLINHGASSVTLKEGERIAQLVVHPLAPIRPYEATELPLSKRGEGGFGSTGF